MDDDRIANAYTQRSGFLIIIICFLKVSKSASQLQIPTSAKCLSANARRGTSRPVGFLILATNSRIFFSLNKGFQIHPFFTALVLSVLFSFQTQAQFSKRFKLSTGYSSYLLETGTEISPVHSLGVTPQFNLWQPRSNFSIAFVSPLTAGVHFRTKVLFRIFFFSDIPVMGEINYGHLATKDFRKWWGVFAGGGYALQSVGEHWQYGVCLSAGFRFWLFKQSFTLRYARFFSEYPEDYFSHRLTIEINLGGFLKDVASKNRLQKFERPFQ